MNRRDIQLILFSSLLLILSFPRIDQSFFAWVALIPLLYAVEGKGVYRAFLLGWLCGFVFHIGLLYWIVVVTTTYGKLVYPLGFLVMLLLVSYLSLYFGSALAIARFIQKYTSIKLTASLPFIWVTMEYLRSFLLSGFPWENLGYSQYHSLSLIQCADITGVYGISFLIVFVNVTLFLLFRNIPHKKIPFREIMLTLIIMTAVTLYGWWRLPEIKKVTDSSPTMNVGLIQGNIDQGTKWNRAYREKAIITHEQLTLKALQKKTRLIIWPEASTPFYFQSESSYQKRIFGTISDSNSYLLLGSPSYASIDRKMYNFNSAFLLSPSMEILGKYDKVHLVPYGEYVPLKEFFPFIHKMVEGIGAFHAGQKLSLFTMPEGPFGVLICYEIIFPNLTRRFVKKGAQFLVNITNDAWFGYTSAPYQHLSMATLRAVENRRFIARAANTGFSALIDATGKIKSSSTLFTQELITGKIRLLEISTFYTNYGDVFSILSTLLSTALFLVALMRKIRK